MSSQHIETRQKLKDICEVSTFENLINSCTLSDTEKTILRLHYLEGKDFRYIGDELGFAEVTIKKKHKKTLQKLNKLL
nr:MAG TPA: ECF sigma factor [Caudoviricetes sp.]